MIPSPGLVKWYAVLVDYLSVKRNHLPDKTFETSVLLKVTSAGCFSHN